MWKKHWRKRKRQEEKEKGDTKECVKDKIKGKKKLRERKKYGWKDVKEKKYKEDAREWGQYGTSMVWPPARSVQGRGTAAPPLTPHQD